MQSGSDYGVWADTEQEQRKAELLKMWKEKADRVCDAEMPEWEERKAELLAMWKYKPERVCAGVLTVPSKVVALSVALFQLILHIAIVGC
jgi:hypothetical protein